METVSHNCREHSSNMFFHLGFIGIEKEKKSQKFVFSWEPVSLYLVFRNI